MYDMRHLKSFFFSGAGGSRSIYQSAGKSAHTLSLLSLAQPDRMLNSNDAIYLTTGLAWKVLGGGSDWDNHTPRKNIVQSPIMHHIFLDAITRETPQSQACTKCGSFSYEVKVISTDLKARWVYSMTFCLKSRVRDWKVSICWRCRPAYRVFMQWQNAYHNYNEKNWRRLLQRMERNELIRQTAASICFSTRKRAFVAHSHLPIHLGIPKKPLSSIPFRINSFPGPRKTSWRLNMMLFPQAMNANCCSNRNARCDVYS